MTDSLAALPPRQRTEAVLLAETVRLIEQDGPLEDHDAMRQAFTGAAGDEERLLARGVLLGRRLQLDSELLRWRHTAWLVVLLLAVLAFLSASGAAAAVVGGGRTLNAVTAFFALLALPTLTLAVWVVAAFSRGGGLFGHLSFGNILLWLLARLPGDRRPRQAMAAAAHGLLQRERLLPWAFGAISHATWACALVLVLAALAFAFSFQAYRLTWETTILDPGFFARFVTLTGTPPHWLGFPLPDAGTLRDPASPSADHRAFAWWLIACVFTYGLLPRLLLAVASWIAWRRGMQRLRLDTADPYYRKLLVRFSGMEESLVVDKEQVLPAQDKAAGDVRAGFEDGGAVVGFELPPEAAWPPSPLPSNLALLERIAGTGAERHALLDRLCRLRPGSLLLVCHAASTPDRGTERFLREASVHAARAGLLLAAASHELDVQRWRQWLAHVRLDGMALFTDDASAAGWLGGAHG